MRAASIDPAPSPYGIARTQSTQNFGATENPKSPNRVSAVLAVTIMPVLNFLESLSENRLETVVPTEISIVIIPADASDTPRSLCISGHAAPRSESGSPRLINARYIIASNSDAIN